jgi:hypothetical protein
MSRHTEYFWFMLSNAAPAMMAFDNLATQEMHEVHDWDAAFFINDLDWDIDFRIGKN